MERKETILLGTTPEDIRLAANIIKEGGLVAFPTETVYGLGADGLNAEAAAKIYEAKGRPSDNPMILHIAKKDDLGRLTDTITSDMERLAEQFWPGPLTMVVKAKDIVPRVTTGGLDTIAVRMPGNETALQLIEAAGVPIAAPSANASGRPSPTTGRHVLDDLNGKIDAVIMGDVCKIGIESTVVDMTGPTPVILRPGYLTATMLSEALHKEVELDPTLLRKPGTEADGGLTENSENFHPRSPGMKYRHYAPKAEMIIFKGEPEKVRLAIAEAKMDRISHGETVGVILYDDGDPEKAAHDFFAQLRAFDKADVDVILAAALKEEGLGFAVMNRMFKSAGYNIIEV